MPAAGWYPDPDDDHITRYWDGSAWTAQRQWNGSAWVQAEIGATPTQTTTAAAAAAAAPVPAAGPPPQVQSPQPQVAEPDLTRTVITPTPGPPATPEPATGGPAAPKPAPDQKQLLIIGGSIVGVLLLIVLAVGLSQVFGGGGGGDFCGDLKGHEAAAAAISSLPSDPSRWTDSQKSSAKEVGDAFNALADDAPSQIKDDAETTAELFNKAINGEKLSSRERAEFRTSADRVDTYGSAKCDTSDN